MRKKPTKKATSARAAGARSIDASPDSTTDANSGKDGVTDSGLPEDKIGERIAHIRQSKRLTHDGLSQLAKLADIEQKGIARTTIRGYELGVYKPGSREIRILAAALEVSPTWLVLGLPDQGEATASPYEKLASESTPPSDLAKIPIAKYLQSLVAFVEMDASDKDAICNLILSLARHKLGEVEYRQLMATFGELGDYFEDGLRDAKEGRPREGFSQEAVSKVGEAIVKKYGVAVGDFVSKHLK